MGKARSFTAGSTLPETRERLRIEPADPKVLEFDPATLLETAQQPAGEHARSRRFGAMMKMQAAAPRR
ncbi:MAG: hypothetical protein JNJ42_02185 [Burkholderiaceae bacterium]|nr:hypothetical protein [Burkholderiaceae bacterium]